MGLVEYNKSVWKGLAENVHIHSNSQLITLRLRHEVPTEVDLAATSFKAAVALTSGDSLSTTTLPGPCCLQ
jgi:hypothetical protein